MTGFTFYGPADLRWVDPRPTPAPSKSDEDVVRELLATRLSGDELNRALQALGLTSYERVLNPRGRDAWTRRKPGNANMSSTHCKNEHPRAQFSRIGADGYWRCMACERASKARQRAKRKQQAA